MRKPPDSPLGFAGPRPRESARLDWAYQFLLGRNPTEDERTEARSFLDEYAAMVADRPQDHRGAAAWEAYARVLLGCNEVLHVD